MQELALTFFFLVHIHQYNTLCIVLACQDKKTCSCLRFQTEKSQIRQWSWYELTCMCYAFDCLKPPKFYHWQPASGMSGIYHLELSTHPPAPTRVRKNVSKIIIKKENNRPQDTLFIYLFIFTQIMYTLTGPWGKSFFVSPSFTRKDKTVQKSKVRQWNYLLGLYCMRGNSQRR